VAGQVEQRTETSSAGDVRGQEPVFCACESDLSSVLTVRCPGAPSAPQLRIENMNENCVEVAWEMPEELADDDVSVCIHCIQSTS